ncbi:ABC transporter ATP-binding protein [Reyranella sp. CPCC 100927]|uniref:ABC transporter ATP-binding protein n=1 Tax=Reyranella sp. CPCC 100927 TaxID=2599616 RepID=UPI0011B79033|nr:ABC transporter ATP-binding protein [Reyranella sp. CPCC 100927]TWT01243.1 ABC transporter ATP-binding protein [Reyranella sp. CPCC 100927]
MTEGVAFRDIVKRYGDTVAVNGVSFTVEAGSLVTLLGPSGCGKTTILRMLAGLENVTSGTISIAGRNVTTLSASERDVSMVFQSYALFPHMNVLENVCYGLRRSGITKAPAAERAREALRQVGLDGYDRRQPSELSGGQQQRVAVARALVLRPQVLLFDEPLSNLDARLRRQMREEIRDLQQRLGLTAVYVTHDQQEALAVSDRIIVMSRGRIEQDGLPRDLYERPATSFVANFMGESSQARATVKRLDGERIVVRLGDAAFTVDDSRAADGETTVAIRPETVAIQRGPASDGALAGTITKAAYVGTHMEYTIDTAAGALFAVCPRVDRPLAPGEAVALTLAPRGIIVVA